MSVTTLSLADGERLACEALAAVGALPEAARATARALINAEADGQKGHGLTRVPSYAEQVTTGKVDGKATPKIVSQFDAGLVVDAGHGFAYPAIELAIAELASLSPARGIAAASIQRSHHFGQAGAHAEALARKGLIAFVYGNSPKAIAYWGSSAPAMGTNPIAFAAPVENGEPLVIDLALSVAARGKIIAAEKNGDSIPGDWALDADGNPTTDASQALKGSMTPMGGAKGAALALMIEVLAAALTGSHFGFEASSLFTGEGEVPNLGQLLIAIDPQKFSGGRYFERMAVLLSSIEEAEGARLPGLTRLSNRAKAREEGVTISDALYQEIIALTKSNAA